MNSVADFKQQWTVESVNSAIEQSKQRGEVPYLDAARNEVYFKQLANIATDMLEVGVEAFSHDRIAFETLASTTGDCLRRTLFVTAALFALDNRDYQHSKWATPLADIEAELAWEVHDKLLDSESMHVWTEFEEY